MRGWQQLVVVVALAAGCGDNNKQSADAATDSPKTQSQVERGQYIMNVLANCTFCHTPLRADGTRDQDKLLSGVDCFADIDSPNFQDNNNGTGCVSTRNLTPDATGLGSRTDEQIKNAFRNGIRTDGKKLSPIMPYWIFHNMSDADADAVVAYLRSIPPVVHTVKPNEPPWSLFNDGTLPQPDFIHESLIPMPRGGLNNQSAMRGRYLSAEAGLCVDCHTPDESVDFQNNLVGALTIDQSAFFSGGRIFPKESLGLVAPGFNYPAFIITRNLTPDATGLKDWSRDQIKNAIAIGKDRDGNAVCAATHGGVISPYAALTDQDLNDIVEYVYNLPAIANDTAGAFCPAPPATNAAESAGQCGNGVDDDSDGVPDDGCPFTLCGNCAGPPVQN